jgi:hypothetical protein
MLTITTNNRSLALPFDRKKITIETNTILRVEALGSYSRLHFVDGKKCWCPKC